MEFLSCKVFFIEVTDMCLICNCTNVHNDFNACIGEFLHHIQTAHPTMDIEFNSFHKLKPYFVRKLKDFNTCCCKYHQDMIEIKVGFNNMRALAIHRQGLNSPCICSCESICENPINGADQEQ